jgi:cobalamin biosynthesis protein CobD/CbiB
MSSTNKRGVIQLVVLIVVLTAGFLINQWIGLFSALGAFAVAIILGTSLRVRRVSREVKAEKAALESGDGTKTVRRPQDHQKKRTRPINS